MENELKSDALNIGSKGQHDLRKTIIRMLKDGKKGKEIAKDLGVSVGHVSNVKKLYETGGATALKPKKRGRPAGKNKVLTPEQEKEIHAGAAALQGVHVDAEQYPAADQGEVRD